MVRLTNRALGRATLARQLLLSRVDLDPVGAIERLAGMQAQEPKPPFVGLHSRLASFRREDLREALHERGVVRATLMRATLHLISAADYLAHRMALQPMLTQVTRLLGDRAAGLDPVAVLAAARRILADRPLRFTELRPLLHKEFPDVDERALGYTVRTHLPLVMVPTGDPWAFPAQAAFTLAESWLDSPLAPDAGPGELARRYLAAFGPATSADAQAFTGMAMKGVFEGMRDELWVGRDGTGRELFDLPEAPRPDPDVEAPARFLPEFDNLLLAHADRGRVIDPAHRPAVVTRNLRVKATFLWDGMVAGIWTTDRKRSTATLRMSPFGSLSRKATTALNAEAEGVLRFVEPDATTYDITVTPG